MRSAATWLVVGAVLVIALVAGVDALREESPRPRASPTSAETEEVGTEEPDAAVSGPPAIADNVAVRAELEVAGISGALYVTDRECRLWALDLPFLEWRSQLSGPGPDCRFALSSRGRALFGKAAWDPAGDLGAVQEMTGETGARIRVSSEATGWSYRFPGSSPAFRPDGTLTFVRDGELWGWVEGRCPAGRVTVVFRSLGATERCGRVLLSQTELRRAFREGVAALRNPSLSEAVWLDPRTAVVLVHGSVGHGVAVLVDGEVRARQAVFTGQVSDLEASPRGTRVALRFGDTVFVFDRRLQDAGSRPGAGGGREIAWPPDERLTVVATESNIYVVRPGDPMIQIPVAVSDIAWAEQ
jgi:hypothetical protein